MQKVIKTEAKNNGLFCMGKEKLGIDFGFDHHIILIRRSSVPVGVLLKGFPTQKHPSLFGCCCIWLAHQFSVRLVANPCSARNLGGGTEITWFWTKCTCKVTKLTELLIWGEGDGAGELMITREDQQSTFTILHVLFNRCNLFLLHVALKNI